MHVAMTTELKEGMAKMKYSLNHFWRFESPYLAFMTGLLQTTSIALVTLLNYYVIIAAASTVIDIAKDFLALMIISEFDNYFYEQYPSHDISKKLILGKDDIYADLFKIQTTTSKMGTFIEGFDELNKLNEFKPLPASRWVDSVWKTSVQRHPRYISITRAGSRNKMNAFLYTCIYQPLRFIYVSFWFYFSPFVLITIQFILPLIVLQRDGSLPASAGEDEDEVYKVCEVLLPVVD